MNLPAHWYTEYGSLKLYRHDNVRVVVGASPDGLVWRCEGAVKFSTSEDVTTLGEFPARMTPEEVVQEVDRKWPPAPWLVAAAEASRERTREMLAFYEKRRQEKTHGS